MKFYKVKMESEEWIMEILGKEIPMSAWGNLVKSLAIPLLLAIAYGMGSFNAYQYTLQVLFLNGAYNPTTHVWSACWPTVEGLTAKWHCENQTIKNPIFGVPSGYEVWKNKSLMNITSSG